MIATSEVWKISPVRGGAGYVAGYLFLLRMPTMTEIFLEYANGEIRRWDYLSNLRAGPYDALARLNIPVIDHHCHWVREGP